MNQRISFDRIVGIWAKIINRNKCPKCLNLLTVDPHDKTGKGTMADLDYVLYICDHCKGEYHISDKYLKMLMMAENPLCYVNNETGEAKIVSDERSFEKKK